MDEDSDDDDEQEVSISPSKDHFNDIQVADIAAHQNTTHQQSKMQVDEESVPKNVQSQEDELSQLLSQGTNPPQPYFSSSPLKPNPSRGSKLFNSYLET